MHAAMPDSFSTREVIELTGVSARQLQWWDEQRIVVPARDGRQRVYSFADLEEIVIIEELRRRRVSLQQVRRVLRFLRREMKARLADFISDERPHHLLFDGKHVYLETDSDQIVDLMRNSCQPMLLLSLADALTPLRVDRKGMMAARQKKTVAATRDRKGEKRRQA